VLQLMSKLKRTFTFPGKSLLDTRCALAREQYYLSTSTRLDLSTCKNLLSAVHHKSDAVVDLKGGMQPRDYSESRKAQQRYRLYLQTNFSSGSKWAEIRKALHTSKGTVALGIFFQAFLFAWLSR